MQVSVPCGHLWYATFTTKAAPAVCLHITQVAPEMVTLASKSHLKAKARSSCSQRSCIPARACTMRTPQLGGICAYIYRSSKGLSVYSTTDLYLVSLCTVATPHASQMQVGQGGASRTEIVYTHLHAHHRQSSQCSFTSVDALANWAGRAVLPVSATCECFEHGMSIIQAVKS